MLQEVGCLDNLLPLMVRNPGTDCVTAAREVLFRLPSDQRTPSGLPPSMYFYQPTFDTELRRRVSELENVRVEVGTEVVGVGDRGDLAWLEVADRSGDRSVIEADWVVGCDGASGIVRESLGIERESFGFEEQWLIFDLKLASPPPALPSLAVQVCDPARPRTELPMPGSRFRFEFMLMPGEDAAELLRPEVAQERLLAPLLPPGSATIERTATYTFSGAVASTWRSGRVLLAGDAAHLMPPFLGQGMCSGIRDAANLAWKLDRIISGAAPDALLDTYTAERRPHVSGVIKSAVEFGRMICVTDRDAAEDRNRALRADPRPLGERFAFRLPSLPPGPLVLDGGGHLFPQPQALDRGGWLDDWIGQRFLVLGADEETLDGAGGWPCGDPDFLIRALTDVPDPAGVIRDWFERRGARVVVVRPDRYVLGTADTLKAIADQIRPILRARVPA